MIRRITHTPLVAK